MKVVWISHRADLGGAEAGLVEAAVALRPLGIKSHALLPSSGQFAESLASAAVPFSITPYRWWMSSRGSPRSRGRNIVEVANLVMWGRLRSKLRALRPDVVVTNSMTVVAGAIAARSLGIPHVWYI
ncbi:MAG: hypothetical protein QOI67_2004, partial [Gaiellaceae bacterium]|nr:hypothetical protein [Gaiellaceae bacterium]